MPSRPGIRKNEEIEEGNIVANLTVNELFSCKPESLITTQDLLVLGKREDARLHTLIRIASAIE